MDWIDIHRCANEMVEAQKRSLLNLGRRQIKTLTAEDLLQPNDYPELEENPCFRYEEGMLAGMQALQIALKALERS